MSGIGVGLAGLELASKFAGVSGFFKRVPRWVWIALAIALAAAALLIWHHRQVDAHDKALEVKVTAARDAQWQARFDHMREKAIEVRQKAEAVSRKISSKLKDQHDAQVRRNASDARDLQLRGPGKAAAPAGCRPIDYPGLSAAAGQPQRSSGAASTAANPVPAENGLSGLPAQRFGIVPWSWLVDVGKNSDDTSDEALKWRNWYVQQYTAWEQLRRSTPAKP